MIKKLIDKSHFETLASEPFVTLLLIAMFIVIVSVFFFVVLTAKWVHYKTNSKSWLIDTWWEYIWDANRDLGVVVWNAVSLAIIIGSALYSIAYILIQLFKSL